VVWRSLNVHFHDNVPPGDNPIAVNKYIIISYHIMFKERVHNFTFCPSVVATTYTVVRPTDVKMLYVQRDRKVRI
jgi:hypothetical protein